MPANRINMFQQSYSLTKTYVYSRYICQRCAMYIHAIYAKDVPYKTQLFFIFFIEIILNCLFGAVLGVLTCSSLFNFFSPIKVKCHVLVVGELTIFVIFQEGNHNFVPLIIPPDTVPALELLASKQCRINCGVSLDNDFVFANTKYSEDHTSGWHSLQTDG